MIGMAWIRKVDPSKCQGQKDWLKLKAQDSTFFILVIQDHIESIGKANTIRRGEVLLNELLAENA